MSEKRIYSTMRLTPEAKALIEALAKKLGVNKTAVVEMAVRVLAEKEKVKNE